MTVDRMSHSVSVRLGDLADAALFVDSEQTSVQANDAAIVLMGEGWQSCAEHVALSVSEASQDGWHHEVVSCGETGQPQTFDVHSSRSVDGCRLILLARPSVSGPAPSPSLEEILESVSDCFFALNAEGVFVYSNSNAANYFGTAPGGLLGQSLLTMEPFNVLFADAYDKTIHEGHAVSYDARSSGQDRWIEVRAYPVDEGMACYFIDITERVSSQERVTFMALHDTLTRLPNRRYLQEELIRAVARAKRGQPSALLFLDMDRFKMVNDSVGHAAGDSVLLEFGGVVGLCVREEDMFARFGGDEFALLLQGAVLEDAMEVGERIQAAVSGHVFRVGGHSFSLGVSIGVTLVDGTLDEGRVMALADDAMYEAKALGGEMIRYRSPDSAADSQSDA